MAPGSEAQSTQSTTSLLSLSGFFRTEHRDRIAELASVLRNAVYGGSENCQSFSAWGEGQAL